MNKILIQIIGWYGVLAVLAAYALANFSVIQNGSGLYIGLNLTGALGIIVEAWSKKDYQPVMLNVVWALVAVIMIAR